MTVSEQVSGYSTLSTSNTPQGTDVVGQDLDNHIRSVKSNIRHAASHFIRTPTDGRFKGSVTSETSGNTHTLSYQDGAGGIPLFELDESADTSFPYAGTKRITALGASVVEKTATASALGALGLNVPGTVGNAVLGEEGTASAQTTIGLGNETLTMSTKPVEFARGADISATATTDIWSGDDGNTVHVLGGGTITSFGNAPQPGAIRLVRFDGAPTLTHSANLNLPGTADISAVSGDSLIAYAEETAVARIVNYQRGDGTPVVRSVFTAVATDTIETVAGDSTHTFTHGLGETPALVVVYLVCTNTELGYSVGDRVVVTSHGADNTTDVNLTVIVNATTVRIVTGLQIHLLNLSTKSWDAITFANWDFYIEAYAR